jgi:hypothetical protein
MRHHLINCIKIRCLDPNLFAFRPDNPRTSYWPMMHRGDMAINSAIPSMEISLSTIKEEALLTHMSTIKAKITTNIMTGIFSAVIS